MHVRHHFRWKLLPPRKDLAQWSVHWCAPIIEVVSLGNDSAEAACLPMSFTPAQLAETQ